MNWEGFKIRCSSLHVLFVEPLSAEDKKNGELSATAKKHLWEVYIEARWGRSEDITTKQMSKGNMVEDEIIDILGFLDDRPYKKNMERKENEWIQGCPDVVADTHLDDAKASWKPKTFAPFIVNPIGKDNLYQMQGYLWLWNKPKGYVSRALVNCPDVLLRDELKKLQFSMNAFDGDPEYIKAADEIIRNLTYDETMIPRDILDFLDGRIPYKRVPISERIIRREVLRDEAIISQIPGKVKKAREYLAWMERQHLNGKRDPVNMDAIKLIKIKS